MGRYGLEEVWAFLPGCCEEGSNLAKGFSPLEGSEPSRDFLLHLHHGHILLGLIVGEWHVRACQKTQNGSLRILETQNKVMANALFASTRGRLRLMKGKSLGHDSLVQPIHTASKGLRVFEMTQIFVSTQIGQKPLHKLGPGFLLNSLQRFEFS